MLELKYLVEVGVERWVEWRRTLHSCPETGFDLKSTSQLVVQFVETICSKLKSTTDSGECVYRGEGDCVSVRVTRCAQTGLIVDVMGKSSKHVPHVGVGESLCDWIAIRTDMDALPMRSSNADLSYKPTCALNAHACGHDGHMAMVLGAIDVLVQVAITGLLPNTKGVRFIFQPAEEVSLGAAVMVKEAALSGIEEVYGLHNWPHFKAGTVRIAPGPIMAEAAHFKVTVEGKGGHGSEPHKAKDALLCASQCVLSLQSIKSREFDSRIPLVLSVCKFSAGEVWNVVPSEAVFEGTTRTFSADVQKDLSAAISRVVQSTAAAHRCTVSLEWLHSAPAVVNSSAQTQHVISAAKKALGPEMVSCDDLPLMASEDFSYFLQSKPGAFFFLGTGVRTSLHDAAYDFNDNVLASGVRVWLHLVQSRLGVQLVEG